MSGMRFKHQWINPPNPSGRMYDETSETERDTYLPVHKQIEAMMIAGQRLYENKRLYYESLLDGYDDSLDGPISPTYGMDVGDLQDMVQSAQSVDTVDDTAPAEEEEVKPKKRSKKQEKEALDASEEAPSEEKA